MIVTIGTQLRPEGIRSSEPRSTACEQCSALQTACSVWVERYRELTEKRKLLLLEGTLPATELIQAIATAESEIRAALGRMSEHNGQHGPIV